VQSDEQLCAAAHAANEQKIGDVGAGDQQDQRCGPGEQHEMVFVLLLHDLDSAAARREDDVRAGELASFCCGRS
jgi:hypothetical protein